MNAWTHVDTVLGRFWVETDGEAVVRSHLPGASPRLAGTPQPDHPVLRQASTQLQAWAEGRLRAFTVPLRPHGTAFQQAVWQALQDIPYGATATYAQVAATIGRPQAYRAVGQANNRNPVAPFIPCHRVLATGGSLGGYGGGEPLKRAMLEVEGATVRRSS